MQQVFVSWSGGKDSCLAGYQAAKNGLKVCYLANMVTGDGQRSWTHGLTPSLLQMQAQALGITLLQHRTSRADYEAEFKKVLARLKEHGISGGVFGDIDLEEHRQWVERVCQQAGITPHLPLWGQRQSEIMRQLIDSGFTAIVVAARADLFDEEILGRKIDPDLLRLLEEMSQSGDITPCGESGEYHTFVTDGPWFQQRIEITEARKILREGHRFLEILGAELRDK